MPKSCSLLIVLGLIIALGKGVELRRPTINDMLVFEVHLVPRWLLDEIQNTFSKIYILEDARSLESCENIDVKVWVFPSEAGKLMEILSARSIRYILLTDDFLYNAKPGFQSPFQRDVVLGEYAPTKNDLLPDLTFPGLVKPKPFGVGDNRFAVPFKIPSYLKDTILTDFTRVDL